jgi:hypothetical protein
MLRSSHEKIQYGKMVFKNIFVEQGGRRGGLDGKFCPSLLAQS